MATNKRVLNLSNIKSLPIDWEDIVVTIKKKLQEILPNAWTDWVESNVGVMLIEAIVYEVMQLLYYTNASVQECYLSTSRTREGTFRIAKTMGYRPYPAGQAVTTLRFSIDDVKTSTVYIPKYTICSSGTNKFYTTEFATIEPNNTYIDVSAKSGTLITDTFICNGKEGYRYQLANNNVNDVIAVTVDDLEYSYVEFMDIKDSEGLYYTVQYDEEYYGYLMFGDGIYGVNPDKGKIIKVLYVSGASKEDNVTTNTITQINDTIYDSDGYIVSCDVTNIESATGGTDCESIKEIKRNVPTIYKTQKRSVTLDDYESLLYSYGGIAKCKAIDNSLMSEIGIYGVKLCIIPTNNLYTTNSFKKELKEYFEEKKIVTTQFEFIDASFVPFDVSIDVIILPTANKNIVNNQIKNLISAYLSWYNRELGDPVYKADIYNLIMKNIPGIAQISNISINENRIIYLSQTPEIGSNIVNITDTMNVLTVGSIINIVNEDGQSTLTAKISNIDVDAYSLVDPDDDENIIITTDMGLSVYNEVYPVMYLESDCKYGDKIIYMRNNDTTDSLLSRRNMILNNIQNCTIYFGDDTINTYRILFRTGDQLYLDKGLVKDIDKDEKMYIKFKKMIPVLDENACVNTECLKLTNYPRFGLGAYLLKAEEPTYYNTTLTMQRSSYGVDYIADYTDINGFVSIKKVYLNSVDVFVVNEDYTIGKDGSSIVWTDTGKEKIKIGKKYFVDIVKKEIDTNTNKYYVRSIDGKDILISPRLREEMYEGQVFDYTTDIYNLMYNEIADAGTITVNIN